MNAPRQGLYASLLIISFAVHVILMVHTTNHQLGHTRAIQGDLMTRQLADDSLAMLAPVDTVSLALMANRYTSRPDVASLKIMAADGRVLTSSGNAPTRSGEVFKKKVLLDQKAIGQIELTLIQPSIGEMIRTQWLPILLSLITHLLLWLLYRVVARPTRREYLATLAREQQLQEQLLALKLHAEQAQKNAVMARAMANPAEIPKPVQASSNNDGSTTETQDNAFILRIGFVDPKQLLGTLSPGLARPYFSLCQTLLEQAIQQNRQHFEGLDGQSGKPVDCKIVQPFGESGAIVSASGNHPQSALFLAQLAQLFNLLTEVVYRRHRDIKRFALHTRTALAEPQHNQPAQALAQSLIHQVDANQLAVHLTDDQVLNLQQYFQLSPFDSPTDAQTREALLVTAMNVEGARFVSKARERILAGDKPASRPAVQQPQTDATAELED
ncbi:hypothetical protein [Alkanindiges illinoisensis]|uniref:Uncharacterized protein n=1 Tax=Alkanindiges illinoisensis TaxID=197183 RepID=A0A4Y7XB20_9GAMM|nr:hypothetical protein [Alkanindiges illinoisensis]TEU25559.1 hypothetical protein E2B99_09350 [Alkanindiges illinoisensis]